MRVAQLGPRRSCYSIIGGQSIKRLEGYESAVTTCDSVLRGFLTPPPWFPTHVVVSDVGAVGERSGDARRMHGCHGVSGRGPKA